jgi:RHS repeat-associated protein
MTSTSALNPLPADYYDQATGNITNDGVHNYIYDEEGRLCAVGNMSPSGGGAFGGMQYIYDAEGRRVAKGTITQATCDRTTNGFQPTSTFVLDQAGQQVSELDGQGKWQHTNVYLGGQLLATYDPQGLHFNITDPLSTKRVQSSATGQAELNCRSLPFGDGDPCTVLQAGEATEHRYTGKERDTESGLDYFGARYYGSNMGRFMSPDPFLNSGHPSDPQTWNRYTYGLNNPLKNVDPTGLYNLSAGCLQDATCSANAKLLRDGLAALNKALDDPKTASALGEAAVVRLSQGLAALGTENDGNNVGVNFAPISGTAAATTDGADPGGTGHYNFTVTFDPNKNKSSTDYAINGDHEGIHAYDYTNYMEHESTTMTPFQQEYRGYQNTAWAAQALGQPSDTRRNTQIWNKSWGAVDRQTLMDKGITKVVTDKDHPETQPHNPNTP